MSTRATIGSPASQRWVATALARTLEARHLVLVLLGLLLFVQPARADPLDPLDIDTRARLAVAASAYSAEEAPGLDPASPHFAPNSVSSYLETNEDGHYATGTYRNGFQIYYSLLRHADEKASAQGLEAWKATGDPVVPLDWGGSFPAFRRGQGLLGVAMLGAGTVARGQSGRWHFEISVVPEGAPGTETGAGELAAAAEAMRVLAANAVRYRIFPRELVVEYVVDGNTRRLAAGDSFRVSLKPDTETATSFKLQVLDGGEPVRSVRYQVDLSGPLAAVAELESRGSRALLSSTEAMSPDGEPVLLTWVFPAAANPGLSKIIDGGDTSLVIAVEARPAPQVLP